MAAPVCHINPSQEIDQPAAKLLASVGNPTDLPSALRAIRQLTYIVNLLMGNYPSRTGSGSRSGQLGDGGIVTRPTKDSGSSKRNQEDGRWAEIVEERVKEKVKIEQEDNPDNFVVFERINQIKFRDTVTGETWTWRRGKTS